MGSAALTGTLVLDVSNIELYNGMQIELLSGNYTGEWASVQLSGTSSECMNYKVTVTYEQGHALATLSEVPLCGFAVLLVNSFWFL